MRLITTRQVADFLGIANSPDIEPHIDQAQAEVQRYIKAKSLDLRQDIERTYDISNGDSIIVLRDGPLSVFNSMTIDGEDVDEDDLDIRSWTVAFDLTGSELVINYDRGYTRETLPFDLKRALIAIAAKINSQPNQSVVYKQETDKVGDASHSLTEQNINGVPGGTGISQAFPPEISAILDYYTKPRFA